MRVVGMPSHVAGHQTAHRGKELRRRSMCEQQRRIRERASQQRLLPQMERTLQQPASTRIRQSLPLRSEEHTSELQSLMRISYAVFCLKKKKDTNIDKPNNQH